MQSILDGASVAGLAAVGVLLLAAVWLACREGCASDASAANGSSAPQLPSPR